MPVDNLNQNHIDRIKQTQHRVVIVAMIILLVIGIVLWILWNRKPETLLNQQNIVEQINQGNERLSKIETADKTVTFEMIDPAAWPKVFEAGQLVTNNNIQEVVEGLYVTPTDTPLAGDISGTYQTGLFINPNSVFLGDSTTGNYLANLLAGRGLTVFGGNTEGSTPTVALDDSINFFRSINASSGSDPTADSLTDSLSLVAGNGVNVTGNALNDSISFAVDLATGSGLTASASGLSLITSCGDGQYLAWVNASSAWACTSPSGGSTPNIFTIFSGDSGSANVDSTTDTLSILGGNGIVTAAADSPDSLTIDIDLATGGGLVFSSGEISLLACSDGQILKRITGAWTCSTDDNTVAINANYAEQNNGDDDVSVSGTLTPLLTDGSGTPQSASINITSGSDVSISASIESSTSLVAGAINYAVVRDDNGDNDCGTGGGDGTLIGNILPHYLAVSVLDLTSTISLYDSSPSAGVNEYQLCASTPIGSGVITAKTRSLKLEEAN